MSDNLFSTIRDSVRRPEATFIETSRGRRLSYAEVFATTGRLAHALREGVTAVVVKHEGAGLDERAVVSALEARLAKYKLPKRVLFVAHLPCNAMGKVLKNELREHYRDLYTLKRAIG